MNSISGGGIIARATGILGRSAHQRRSPVGLLSSGNARGCGYWMNEMCSASHSCIRWRVLESSMVVVRRGP
nr:MAG TPA: hypothetical protein [Caudoviricetes sp.]